MRSPWLVASLALVAACGDDAPNTSGDAGVDAPVDAGPTTGTLTVTVVNDLNDFDNGTQAPLGVPRAGVEVYFVELDGTAHIVTTGADGKATSPVVRAGTAALVLRRQNASLNAITAFVGLPLGASVTAGPHPDPGANTDLTPTMTLVSQSSGEHTPFLACMNSYARGAGQFDVYLFDPCPRTNRTILVERRDAATEALLSYSTTVANLTPGATVTMPAFVNPGQLTGTFAVLPSEISSVAVNGHYRDEPGYLGGFTMTGAPNTGALTLQTAVAPVGASTWVRSVLQVVGARPVIHLKRHAGAITTFTTVGAEMPPFVSGSAWDPATRSVTWTQTGPMRSADAVIVTSYSSRSAPSLNLQLSVIAPHTGASVALPPLPVALADLLPTASDVMLPPSVLLVDVAEATGYAAVAPTADGDVRDADFAWYGSAGEVWLSGANPP